MSNSVFTFKFNTILSLGLYLILLVLLVTQIHGYALNDSIPFPAVASINPLLLASLLILTSLSFGLVSTHFSLSEGKKYQFDFITICLILVLLLLAYRHQLLSVDILIEFSIIFPLFAYIQLLFRLVKYEVNTKVQHLAWVSLLLGVAYLLYPQCLCFVIFLWAICIHIFSVKQYAYYLASLILFITPICSYSLYTWVTQNSFFFITQLEKTNLINTTLLSDLWVSVLQLQITEKIILSTICVISISVYFYHFFIHRLRNPRLFHFLILYQLIALFFFSPTPEKIWWNVMAILLYMLAYLYSNVPFIRLLWMYTIGLLFLVYA